MAMGSFFKGEKKKKKKWAQGANISYAPVFIPPSVIKKGKEKY